MDIFTWSLPFVSEKVAEMLYHVIKPVGENLSDEESSDEEGKPSPRERLESDFEKKPKRSGALRKKVKAVARMVKMFRTLRESHEIVT